MANGGWLKDRVLPSKAESNPRRHVKVKLNINNKQLEAVGYWALNDEGVTVDLGSHIIANCQGNCGGNCVSGCTGSCTAGCGSTCSSNCVHSCSGDCGGACRGGCDGCSGPDP